MATPERLKLKKSTIKAALFFLFLQLVFLTGFAQTENLLLEMESLKKVYAPDSRTAIFDVYLSDQILSGETDQPKAKAELLKWLESRGLNYKDDIRQLPTAEYKDKYGIVNVSVANLRSEMGESAELASQVLLGTRLKILEKDGSWYRVQTPDAYIGFMSSSSIVVSKSGDQNNPYFVIITSPYAFAFEADTKPLTPISDLTFGNLLDRTGEDEDYYYVSFPDKRKAKVKKADSDKYENWLSRLDLKEEGLINAALQMKGLPYLWGGTSWKGVDCSGFTKTVYLTNGLVLPRDASQQALIGNIVDTTNAFSTLKSGDLLFFGSRKDDIDHVTHVGMYLNNKTYIHSSGYVRLASFDPASEFYDSYNAKRFLFAKRPDRDRLLKLNAQNLYFEIK